MSQHLKDGLNASFISVNSSNSLRSNYPVVDEKSRILAWLSPLEPRERHRDIRAHRADEVGDWLLQTQEYRNWFGSGEGVSDGSALFCYGGPGVGKTYISSLVVDTLYDKAAGEKAAVACFYFNFVAQREQSPTAILGSVLKQIVGGLDGVPERIVRAFRDREKISGGQRLALGEIVEFLQDISSSRRTFICIDALDECPAGPRWKLLDILNQIVQRSPGTRLFLTGRPHIRAEVEKHLGGRAATISITSTKNDITKFLQAKLKEDAMPDAMDDSLEEDIMQTIPDTFSEIFLLASLSIDTILQELTIHRRREKLRAMQHGLGLGDAYGATLDRIKAQGGAKATLGMDVLMWITHSRRPLREDEICHAIAIQIGSDDLNLGDIPTISTLLGCCQGLATIDKGTSTIKLIHYTIQDYLCQHPDLFGRAHSTMAETCLTYLNFQHVRSLPSGSFDPQSAPFLEYSSLYWGTHMRMEDSERAKKLATKLLTQFDSHLSAKVLWDSICREFAIVSTPGRKPFSALHCVSYFGIAEVAESLIKNRWDVNGTDGGGMTPLIWAARCGHEEVVRLLLREKQTQPNQQDTNTGRTALSWAAENGHAGVVKLFLEPQFVTLGNIGQWWRKGPRVAGRLFRRRYVNPDSLSKSGRTPLSWAAQNGHEEVVKLLLQLEDVNPNRSGKPGQTPLALAIENGHDQVAELLRARHPRRNR